MRGRGTKGTGAASLRPLSHRGRAVGRALVGALAAFVAAAAPARAQYIGQPHLDWRTARTEHFDIHYPAPAREWALDVASRLEGVRDAVYDLVGFVPASRITVVVEDPYATSNGSAWPFLDRPGLLLWPVPPEPQIAIGNNRGWGEMLAVHEFAHLAHLTRPSRNPREHRLWRLLTINLGPVARKAPPWVYEGYATYVEGKLTGSGRPHGVYRAAVLRQWALEGKLPTYYQLNSTAAWQGGSMRYLAGSAFLEWLVAQRGDSSLAHLWRRMSARQTRGFVPAFAGVFGGTPDELYGRFAAELTGKALEAERALSAAGRAEGALVQRLTWTTGEPALSRDGKRIAIVLRSRTRPSRLVVWNTEEDTLPTRVRERQRAARERLARLDPEDVPAIEYQPRPKRAIATLRPHLGRGHDAPRWMPDGKRLLVVRNEPTGDGAYRPDLFLWDYTTKRMRRVTRGAGIRHADPSPDGASALGVRCQHGACDLVRVDLASGEVRTVAEGSPARSFDRPRFAPDGRSAVVAVQAGGAWRLALVTAGDSSLRLVGPDDGASRYAASFTTDGRAVIAVSEAGGVQNLERIDLASGDARPVTRVTGGAIAPEPHAGGRLVYFLRMHSQGLDLARIAIDSAAAGPVVALAPSLAPVAPRSAAAADTFPVGPVREEGAYGMGPRRYRVLPALAAAEEGVSASVSLTSIDPVGRLSWQAQAGLGSRGAWEGGSVGGTWRGTRPWLRGETFMASHRPMAQRGAPPAAAGLDAELRGAMAEVMLPYDLGARRATFRLGGSGGTVLHIRPTRSMRVLAFGEASGRFSWPGDGRALSTAVSAHISQGRTGPDGWTRSVATARVRVVAAGFDLSASGLYGETSADAPPFERFLVGGARSPYLDGALLSQRITMPALPVGVAAGRRVATWRVSGPVAPYVEAFYWAASTGDGTLGRWHRVAGLQGAIDVPAVPLARVIDVSFVAGVAHSIDAPFRRRTRAYAQLSYRP